MPEPEIDPRHTAVIIELMQKDATYDNGIYGQQGLPRWKIQSLIPPIRRVCEACKAARIPIIATKMTILSDLDGKAMGLSVLKDIRPFLIEDGLRDGSWGHEVIDELPHDYEVRKWVYNSFYQTELEKYLQALQTRHVVFTGAATNIAVDSTAREAAIRNYEVTVLSDCCGSFDNAMHEASLLTLGRLVRVIDSGQFLSALPAQK